MDDASDPLPKYRMDLLLGEIKAKLAHVQPQVTYLKEELLPEADPDVDLRRLDILQDHGLSHAIVVARIKKALLMEGDSDKIGHYVSAKNIVLALKVIRDHGKPGFMSDFCVAQALGRQLNPNLDNIPVTCMSKNVFKWFIGYSGTKRLDRNLKFWKDRIAGEMLRMYGTTHLPTAIQIINQKNEDRARGVETPNTVAFNEESPPMPIHDEVRGSRSDVQISLSSCKLDCGDPRAKSNNESEDAAEYYGI